MDIFLYNINATALRLRGGMEARQRRIGATDDFCFLITDKNDEGDSFCVILNPYTYHELKIGKYFSFIIIGNQSATHFYQKIDETKHQ